MGIPHALRIWKLGQAVAKNDKLADIKGWGKLPKQLETKRAIMPTLMHGKHITFGNNVSINILFFKMLVEKQFLSQRV